MATIAGNGLELSFARELCRASYKQRGNLDPPEIKHAALGLIFLRCISGAGKVLHGKRAAN